MGDGATATAPAPGAVGDDGLGPIDPNSEEATGVPGGRQPGDDGYVEPETEAEASEPPAEPPTPPAALPDDDGEPEDEEPSGPELFLFANKELGLKVSGRKPDTSVLKYKGGKIDLGGQFDREDRFLTVDVWQVTGDNDQDTINKLSGEVKSTSKAQSATLCGTARIEDWLKARLKDQPELMVATFAALELDVPADEES